ncbi:MAG: DUF262 domain-containing protein [Clostridia bacterium]|nr:DUF262 domain-containing protein [Clostridia bacterium]
MEINKPLSMQELLNNEKFSIPLYQRNFSWTYEEISQLTIDILDNIKDGKNKYYIGTLVICKKASTYSIIDGQQRLTAIILLLLAIQNNLSKNYINDINLHFTARAKSNKTLQNLLDNKQLTKDDDVDLSRGYNDCLSIIRENNNNDIIHLASFLLNNTYIFINEIPSKTDVNLYFERFNSRGEQLEYHEIIKAELMQKLVDENTPMETVQKFAKIWDTCSVFETPCIRFFTKKKKNADQDNERETVFNCTYDDYSPGKCSYKYGYALTDIYNKIAVNNENKKNLLNYLKNERVSVRAEDENSKVDENDNYRCIINFNTFLFYVLYITENTTVEKTHFDDKKLLKDFNVSNKNCDWILRFGENLLKAKFIFDNFIIRRSLETTQRLSTDQWFLHKSYRVDSNDKRRGHLYVQTRFDKNSFTSEEINNEVILLQSMFATTFTSYKDTKWLFSTLSFLFDNATKLNEYSFGETLRKFLQTMAVDFALDETRIGTGGKIDNQKMRYNNGVPVYTFNFVDYVLWKNRNVLSKTFGSIPFDKFTFTYRRSIEHWYPQHPDKTLGYKKMADELLHSFGNLCIIVASQNSSFGNLNPIAKYDQWQIRFSEQSLKLQMMAHYTKDMGGWNESNKDKIIEFEKQIILLINNFIGNVKQSI